MLKWKIKAYAVLVKAEIYDLETTAGSTKPVVEDSYKIAVAEYLTNGTLPQ